MERERRAAALHASDAIMIDAVLQRRSSRQLPAAKRMNGEALANGIAADVFLPGSSPVSKKRRSVPDRARPSISGGAPLALV